MSPALSDPSGPTIALTRRWRSNTVVPGAIRPCSTRLPNGMRGMSRLVGCDVAPSTETALVRNKRTIAAST